MGIYIEGMKMPKSCGYCPLRHEARDGDECYLGASLTEYQKRPDDCPLVPVPSPGRLIDADKIGLTDFEIILCQKGNPFKNALEMLLEKIENAPTIIPASEDGK